MKQSNDIDELFKKGLHQDFQVDEKLWQDVQDQLPSDSPKKGFWIYLNSFSLLVILGMSMLLRTDNVVSQQGKYEPINIENSLAKNEIKQLELPEQEKNLKTESPNEKTNQTIHDKKEKAHQTVVQDLPKTLRKKDVSSVPKSTNEQVGTKPNIKARLTNNNSQKPITKTSFLTKTESFATTYKKQKVALDKVELKQLNKLSLLGYKWEQTFSLRSPKKLADSKLNKMQQKVKPHFLEYELEYYQSIEQEKKLSGLSPDLSNYRNEGEKSLQVESYGLHVFRKVKFLHLGVGLHYSQFEEQAVYDISEIENGISVRYDTSYQIVNSNFNSNGIPVILIKEEIDRIETPTTDINERRLLVRNEINRIQLPVSIGYRRNFGRIEAGLRTAFVFNYINQKSGAYISDDRSRLLTFNENEQINSFVYAHRNQVSLGYALNEFFVLGGRFNYEYDLNSFTKEYNSRLQHYGLGLYLRFQPK